MTDPASCASSPTNPDVKPAPDLANLHYGPHEHNDLDFWHARRQGPAPLVIFFHGGGFRRGDKGHLPAPLLAACLDQGFAVAAANYRLSHQAAFPAPMLDGARAVQFLRAKANDLNIDPTRVTLIGGSAGAGISLWLGFHPDLADPTSLDPIAHQSTQPCAVGTINGQCSYDPRFFKPLGLSAGTEHPFMPPFYGLTWDEIDGCTPRACKLFDEAAPINYLTADAPPVFMIYEQPDEPLPPGTVERKIPTQPRELPKVHPVAGLAIHHPRLGQVLKQRLDALGIPNELHINAKGRLNDMHPLMVRFLRQHLDQ